MKGLLKNFGHYLGSNFAIRAISFVSIPIFTRLLNTSDYGIINLFSTYAGIFSIVMTFNIHSTVGRYFYDKKSGEDFKDFVGTTFLLLIFSIVPFSLVFFCFKTTISQWLNLPLAVTLIIPLTVIVSTTGSIFNQIMQPLYQSKKIALLSIISAYSSFILALVLVIVLTSNKYMGQIWAQLAIGVIFFLYYFKELKPYTNLTFKKKYLSYIISYSIPLIPYSLSGVILAQIDRVQINSYEGASSVGMYSFAYNIAMLMNVFSVTLFQTWIPRYFEYMNAKDYEAHDRDTDELNKYLVIGAAFLILFGNEIGVVLAAKNFHVALNIIPIIVIGYYFEAVFTVYGRHIGYSRKTIYSTLIAFGAGLLNIGLNIIYIPIYGYKVASWTTLISYVFMVLLAYLVSKFIIKIHTTPVTLLFKSAIFLIPVIFFTKLIDQYNWNIILTGLIKMIVFTGAAYLLIPKRILIQLKTRWKAIVNT